MKIDNNDIFSKRIRLMLPLDKIKKKDYFSLYPFRGEWDDSLYPALRDMWRDAMLKSSIVGIDFDTFFEKYINIFCHKLEKEKIRMSGESLTDFLEKKGINSISFFLHQLSNETNSEMGETFKKEMKKKERKSKNKESN